MPTNLTIQRAPFMWLAPALLAGFFACQPAAAWDSMAPWGMTPEAPATFAETPARQGQFRPLVQDASEIALHAMGLLGIQYKYGGNSPESGLDCSGLVTHVFREAWGATLPRTSTELSRVGTQVEKHELQPGDLVFFNTLRRAFSHVGIYLGDSKFIHAPSSGGKVRIESMNVSYWKKRFNGARRVDHPQPGNQLVMR